MQDNQHKASGAQGPRLHKRHSPDDRDANKKPAKQRICFRLLTHSHAHGYSQPIHIHMHQHTHIGREEMKGKMLITTKNETKKNPAPHSILDLLPLPWPKLK